MRTIAIIAIIADSCVVGWLGSVGTQVAYELDYKKPILYVVPIQSILGKLPVVPVGTNTFPGAPGDRRMDAIRMDARLGSSACGHWDGPVTCNKSREIAAREAAGRKVPCEHDASPCLGHATVCSGCPLTILLGSLGSSSAR
jgi:hypothetical protein